MGATLGHLLHMYVYNKWDDRTKVTIRGVPGTALSSLPFKWSTRKKKKKKTIVIVISILYSKVLKQKEWGHSLWLHREEGQSFFTGLSEKNQWSSEVLLWLCFYS